MVPPLTDRKVSGGTFPALIWHDVMESAHLDLSASEFTEPPPSQAPTTTEDPEVVVFTPELLGLTLEEASQLLLDSETGITILAFIEIETTEHEPNVIIGQSPIVGSTMVEGGSMVLEIAVPPPPVLVSDLVTFTVEQAQVSVESSGLIFVSIVASDPENPESPAGIVWAQDPIPGVELPVGSTVTVQVTPEPEEEEEEEEEEE